MSKSERIDLGISVCHALNPGRPLSCGEIAAYADVTPERIRQIEQQALEKVRKALRQTGVEELSQ